MSRQENNPNKPPGLTGTTTPSRLTRTNPNQNQRLLTNPSSSIDPPPTEEDTKKLTLLPTKVSTLDKNVLFQDMDKNKTSAYQSTNSSRVNNPAPSNPLEGDKAIGLISNVFLGSTSRFVKGTLNNATTPIKIPQEIQQEIQDTNKNTPAKFSRNKDIEQKSRTISMKQPAPETALDTDRSGAEGGKKIERRPIGSRETRERELKFTQKKDIKMEESSEKIVFTGFEPDGKAEAFKLVVDKTQVLRAYQPNQRPNPYNRSRIVTEQPPPVVQKEPVVEKPKEQPPKPINNRLVQSRLQSQLSESKVSTEKEVKPIININRTSESRLLTEINPPEPTPPPKEEIKPKPYSRSFVSKKVETEPLPVTVQPTISQSTVNPPSAQKPLQQSKAIEQKSKSNVKQTVTETNEAKIVLKKSGCVTLIVKRLIKSRIVDAFSILKSHRQTDRIKKINQCSILSYSMGNIVKIKELNLIKLAFQNIKKKFTTAYITSLKSYAEQTPTNHKNTGCNLLDRLYLSKMRQNFRILKVYLQRFRNKTRCVVTFESFFKRKITTNIKRAFEAIKLRQRGKVNLLNQFSAIFNNVNKGKLSLAFARIGSVKPAVAKVQTSPVKQQPQRSRIASKVEESPSIVNTSNQSFIDKLEKLKKTSAAVQSEVTTLQSTIQKKKKQAQGEKGNMLEKVTLLKHQNEQVNNQIEIKKHRNDQIKKEMENIAPKNHRELEEQLTQPRENKLEFLTNIYISNFKNSQDVISVDDIANNYNLKAQDSSVLFNQWASILRNVELKRLIAAYEGVDPRENKGRANIISQQGLISRLIRSYVKQQYFWHWIHLSAQTG